MASSGSSSTLDPNATAFEPDPIKAAGRKSELEWKKELTPEQYRILRRKGTQAAGTGEYDSFFPKTGYFACAGCGFPLYSTTSKSMARALRERDPCYAASTYAMYDALPRSDSGFSGDPVFPSLLVNS